METRTPLQAAEMKLQSILSDHPRRSKITELMDEYDRRQGEDREAFVAALIGRVAINAALAARQTQ